MLTLYAGDTSVCSQKVRLVLYEKGVPWEGVFIDLGKGEQFDPEYMKLNPNAVVPTLVDDGKVIIESTMINEYLDDLYPEPPLRPADPYRRAQMRLWVKQLDDTIHEAINTATFAIRQHESRSEQLSEEQKARLAKTQKPERRAKLRDIYMHGIGAERFAPDLKRLDKMLADMEAALAEGPWLTGKDYSLADAGFTPYVNRLNVLGLSGMWEGSRPQVADWFDRARARPNYKQAILDHDPADKVAAMGAAGAKLWPEIEARIGSS